MPNVPSQRRPGQSGGADYTTNLFAYKKSVGQGNTGGKNTSGGGSKGGGCFPVILVMGATVVAAGYGVVEAVRHLA